MTLHAVILAGGRGTRLTPLTDRTPKPLLPVAGSPVVVHQLSMLAALGISRVVLTTSYRAEQFRSALGDGSAWDIQLDYCRETEPLGTGGALAAAVDHVGVGAGDALLVLNGDQLSAHDIQAQLRAFESARTRLRAVATLHAKRVTDARAYGLIDVGRDARILGFREKPRDLVAGTVNAGTYVLDPQCLNDVPRGREVSFEREVVPGLLDSGATLTAYIDDAYGIDVGTPYSLVAASRDVVLRNGVALIDPSATVDPSASVHGGSYVGPAVFIGANAVIEASIVMAGAHIGDGVAARRCAIGRGARVEGPIVLQDIVIGDDAVVGPGYQPQPGERIPTAAVLP